MTRKVKDAVVVVTGASSGIGRATALLLARKGAVLVLAARREQPLNDLVEECKRNGARAIAVPTDTSNEDQVQNLARQAIENYGRLDVWINNAGVALYAPFEQAPPELFRQVLETNVFGYVYGARAALPYFREQDHGVLINNSSVWGTVGAPYLSAYITSKFAVRGFSESLRQELLDEKNTHVCTILPASIDTPFFDHAANYTGHKIKPLNPVYDADLVAARMVGLIEHPKKEIVVGNAGRLARMQRRFMPNLADKTMARQVEIDHLMDEPAPPTSGNLLAPVAFGTDISGGWKASGKGTGWRAAAVGLLAAVPAIFAWRRLRDSGKDTPPERLSFRLRQRTQVMMRH